MISWKDRARTAVTFTAVAATAFFLGWCWSPAGTPAGEPVSSGGAASRPASGQASSQPARGAASDQAPSRPAPGAAASQPASRPASGSSSGMSGARAHHQPGDAPAGAGQTGAQRDAPAPAHAHEGDAHAHAHNHEGDAAAHAHEGENAPAASGEGGLQDVRPSHPPGDGVSGSSAPGGAMDGAAHPGHHGPPGAGETEPTVWTCAMHPQIRRPEPGDCPICGMDLVPDRSTAPGSFHGAGGGPDRVRLSPQARRLARIETAAVRRARPRASRRLLGRLERDESALSAVTAWVSGRIEKLHVDTTGVRVRRGQRLASIYSPEIYAAQSDLQVAMRQLRASEGTPGRSSARKAVEASRQRLALLGMPEFAIDRMAERSSPQTRVPIRSPATGTVLERQVTEGQYVETGDVLYRVADLSTLWVQLDAHGSDLGNLEVGDPVTLGIPAMPELSLHGRVRFVEPTVDPQTRVAEVRVEVPNRKGVLRPGMYVEAVVETRKESSQERIFVVPESAVIFTGRRSVVYVEENNPEGEPVYVPRRVMIGQILDGAYSIASGLSEGERVVVEGAFVLDADLQIRGGPSALSAEAAAEEAGR